MGINRDYFIKLHEKEDPSVILNNLFEACEELYRFISLEEEGACRFDHKGSCQKHGDFFLDGEECFYPRNVKFLKSLGFELPNEKSK